MQANKNSIVLTDPSDCLFLKRHTPAFCGVGIKTGSPAAFLPTGDLTLDNYLGVFDRVPFAQFGAQGWALNPSVQLAGYAWPVHTISKSHIPTAPQSTFVALYRNAQWRVRFSVLTPAAMQLLVFMQSNGADWTAAQKTLAPVTAQTGPPPGSGADPRRQS